MLRTLQLLIWTFLVGCALDRVAFADTALMMIGQPATEATLVNSETDGTLQFRIAGKTRDVSLRQLVRWKTLPITRRQSELVLVDGSRLVLADVWTGEPVWQVLGDVFMASTELFGKIELPCSQVRAILLKRSKVQENCPQDLAQPNEAGDSEEESRSDVVCFLNGDRWEGKLDRLAKNDQGQWCIFWSTDSAKDPLPLPVSQVAAIGLGNRLPRAAAKARIVVGLRDGSVLWAESLVANSESLQVTLSGGVELIGSDHREVAHLRSLESESVFLSDLEPADYRHLPYLEIRWPYQNDRNVLAKPLRAQGQIFAKGIGMPTAARLTYPLPAPGRKRWQRFVAAVAVDDAAGRGGSVIFRVYLKQAGSWQLAYESPQVRGTDVPVPASVDLGMATQLALVTDFAERGDELDYANWLDARLE
ncbi:MAG: NPCBM/NEW2 domain-containing protein [Bythopirellula sp.]